ncbi:MAG: glycine zipper 2TM domain-containing protein [Bacteroidetes bacterium]|nr:glycine zipper 2TM domain-containing protein [Bacteroidota bacterium]
MRNLRFAGRLLFIGSLVIGFTACSNVKIESVAGSEKEVGKDSPQAKELNPPVQNTREVHYVQNPVEYASVERADEQESASGGAVTPSTSTETKKKKGLSNTAKGAMIGAGAGAIAGAVISKKKVKGAVIGGVVGAAAGAGVGILIDKRKKESAE